MTNKKKRIFIIGPTGVGKSEFSLFLAEKIGGRIISMDSMQIYMGMDIGTAKVEAGQRKSVKHYMLDIVEPGTDFTVYDYKQKALVAENQIRSDAYIPIYVGGTGLYLNALIYDYSFGNIAFDPTLRNQLEEEYDRDRGLGLYKKLHELDPDTANKLSINDKPRIVRALIMFLKGGKKKSSLSYDMADDGYDNFIIQMTSDRPLLYERINKRVDHMFEAGLVDEVKGLLEKNIDIKCQAMQAIGYREIVWYLRGLVNLREAKDLICRFSRNYAKRQETWFRKSPVSVKMDLSKQSMDSILPEINAFLNK